MRGEELQRASLFQERPDGSEALSEALHHRRYRGTARHVPGPRLRQRGAVQKVRNFQRREGQAAEVQGSQATRRRRRPEQDVRGGGVHEEAKLRRRRKGGQAVQESRSERGCQCQRSPVRS